MTYTRTRVALATANPEGPVPRPALAIVGASGRAAAFSALRAGFTPAVCDRFGDADLCAHAAWAQFAGGRGEAHGPELAAGLTSLPASPWIYTGALEHWPDVVDELARHRPLWGVGGPALRAVRDPFRLAEALHRAGVPMPETRPARTPPRAPRGWLLKPLAGRGARPAGRQAPPHATVASYYQRRVAGTPASGLFVAGDCGCRLLGATRQLVGEPWLHARSFAWCGNLAPLVLDAEAEAALRWAGEAVAEAFALRGLFGIDFILARAGVGPGPRVVPLEVNPRYTAAVELLEHALGFAALAFHAAAFRGGDAAPAPGAHVSEVVGKAVVYAPSPLVTAEDLLARYRPDPFSFPRAADLPPPGRPIARGEPVLTVFASGADEDSCRERLAAGAREALRHFQPLRRRSYYPSP